MLFDLGNATGVRLVSWILPGNSQDHGWVWLGRDPKEHLMVLLFLRWFARNHDFLFHRQNSVSKEVLSPSGMCSSFPILLVSNFSLAFRSPLHTHASLSAAKVPSSAAKAAKFWAKLDLQAFPSGATHLPAQPLLYGKAPCNPNTRNCRVFLCSFITQKDGWLPHNSALPLEKQQSCRGINY